LDLSVAGRGYTKEAWGTDPSDQEKSKIENVRKKPPTQHQKKKKEELEEKLGTALQENTVRRRMKVKKKGNSLIQKV